MWLWGADALHSHNTLRVTLPDGSSDRMSGPWSRPRPGASAAAQLDGAGPRLMGLGPHPAARIRLPDAAVRGTRATSRPPRRSGAGWASGRFGTGRTGPWRWDPPRRAS